MDPTSTRSWWLDHSGGALDGAALGEAALPATANVVVVGAGMTGCSVAYWLGASGIDDVVVVDSRGVSAGATGRNGGHLWPAADSEFERETAASLLRFIEEHAVDCDLQRGGAVSLTRHTDTVTDTGTGQDPDPGCPRHPQGQHWDAAKCKAALGTSAFSSGVYSEEAAQFFPAKVTAALLAASPARLFAPVEVVGIASEAAGQIVVTTSTGRRVVAAAVVVATNGWTPALLPELAGVMYPVRNHVIMTAPARRKCEVQR